MISEKKNYLNKNTKRTQQNRFSYEFKIQVYNVKEKVLRNTITKIII